jgi:hypothetical protein
MIPPCHKKMTRSAPQAVNLIYITSAGVLALFTAHQVTRALYTVFSRWIDTRKWHCRDVVPDYINVHRFEPGEAGAKDFLQQHGFVVYRSVLSPTESRTALHLLWNWLEAAAPKGRLDRDNPDSWDDWPDTVEGGILPYFGSGQSEGAWYVRSRPKVFDSFVQGTETLTCRQQQVR